MSTGGASAHFEFNETLEQARARNVRDALMEDIGQADWTAMLVPESKAVEARVLLREPAVLCGRDWFDACIQALDPQSHIEWFAIEGALVEAHTEVCRIRGLARAILSGERAALNFIQLLSSTATLTRRYVDAITGVSPNPRGCVILDTRKTLPGLRQAQKYAVRMGGGQNQRLALWHGILIKENHIAAAGGIDKALAQARALGADVKTQIEVETLEQLRQALAEGADSILLDNFSLQAMHEAVAINAGRALLEASGGVSLDHVKQVAATGVDRISIGRLTKDVQAIDFSMRIAGLG